MSETEIKKKKGLIKKISGKFKKEDTDELMIDTLSELKGIVSSMKDVFNEFESGYEEQLDEERSKWQKIRSSLPKFLQDKHTKNEVHRLDRIKHNKNSLSEMEDSFSKLEMVLTSSSSSIESISEAYVDIAGISGKHGMDDLERKMEEMQLDMSNALGDINTQISLIKSALDNMAGQLDEHGVVLTGIDGKIEVLDEKMDRAETLLKKISKKITGNSIILLALVGVTTAVIAQKFLMT